MKKILTLAIVIFTHIHSFAYSILQTSTNNVTMEGNDAPPPPTISPFVVGEPEPIKPGTPIDFIVPLLIITAIILMIYFVYKNKKNKLRSI